MFSALGRESAARINELNRSLGGLLGIATGLLADEQLADVEIQFLNDWLKANDAVVSTWPGDVIYNRVKEVLADGVITEDERAHLVETLRQLVGGTLSQLAESTHVTQLLPCETPTITFAGSSFCLTGDFVFAPKAKCEEQIEKRGGEVKSSISKKLTYLVVGGLGSKEWKHGSFGTKIEKAMELKKAGAPICIVHEDHWAKAL